MIRIIQDYISMKVNDINKLLEEAKQLNIDWNIKIIENPKELYKKGLF